MKLLVRNDIFELDENLYRLLHVVPETGMAVIIDRYATDAMPVLVCYIDIAHLPPVRGHKPDKPLSVTTRQRHDATRRASQVKEFVSDFPKISDKNYRAALAKVLCEKHNISRPTLYHNARLWWQGGQSESSLYPRYDLCGSNSFDDIKKGASGAKIEKEYQAHAYPLTKDDLEKIEWAIDKFFLIRNGQTLAETVRRLWDEHYFLQNEDGLKIRKPVGQKPTYSQVHRYLFSIRSIEEQIAARKGERFHAKSVKATLGSGRGFGRGPGDIYDVDAHRCEMSLATDDRLYYLGQPILYLLKDRATDLHVGMYIGIGEPSWMGVALALINVCEDKEALCLRLGIPYHENDWPAHELMPNKLAGDRGELATNHSGYMSPELHVDVTLFPGGTPQAKGSLEGAFFLERIFFQTLEYGYSPPSNEHLAYKGNLSAAMTFAEFEKIMWLRFILHNRRENVDLLEVSEIREIDAPSPINIWNYRLRKFPSFVHRAELNDVKLALLPRYKGSITSKGFRFRGCHFSNPLVVQMFSKIRGAQAIVVSFDPRSANTIWVRMESGEIIEADLAGRSVGYKGMTFDQVALIRRELAIKKRRSDERNAVGDAMLRQQAAELRKKIAADNRKKIKLSKNKKLKDAKTRGQATQYDRNQNAIANESAHQPASGLTHMPRKPSTPSTSEPARGTGTSHFDDRIQRALEKFQ